jgi:hypothetical protein
MQTLDLLPLKKLQLMLSRMLEQTLMPTSPLTRLPQLMLLSLPE